VAVPVINLTTVPEIPDGENDWYVTSGSIDIFPDYQSDLYYRWGTSGSWFISSGATPVSGANLVIPSGQNALYYFASGAVSGAGAIDVRAFKFDDLVPSGAIVAPSGLSYINSLYPLEASGSDSISGMYKYIFRANGRTVCVLDYPINIHYWDTTDEIDGIKLLSLELVDYAGNSYEDELYMYTDNSAPTITHQNIPTSIIPSGCTIYGDAVDFLSPIDNVEYRVRKVDDDLLTEVWTEAYISSGSGTEEVAWQVPLSGLASGDIVTVYIRASDVAGNTQSPANYTIITFPVE